MRLDRAQHCPSKGLPRCGRPAVGVASKWRGLRARVEAGWLRRGTRLGAEHDSAVGAELLLQKKTGQRKDRLIVASSHFLGVSYFASRAFASSFCIWSGVRRPLVPALLLWSEQSRPGQ